MNRYRNAAWLPIIAVLLGFTAACGTLTASTSPAPSPTENTPTEVPAVTQEPAPPTVATSDTPVADPAALCPKAGEGTSQYVSKENGFCLLYPAGFSAIPDDLRPKEAINLLGPRETNKPKSQERISVLVSIEYNGPADGLDSNGYARKWYDLFAKSPDFPYDGQPGTMGGQPDVVLSNLPGYTVQRSAFVVANGIKYRITLSPQPEDMPELAGPASLAWDIVTKSTVFFPPQSQREVKRPEEVCPKESSEMRLYRDDKDGYCFLYPADFAPVPEFSGMVKGGPILGQAEGFGDVQTYVAVGTFGHIEGQTPRQVLEPRMAQIDSASVQDATIAGYPAVTFRSLQGPWPSRQAIISVNGDVYTIVGEPWDPERYPNGIPYLDRLWEVVTSSLAFFDPWR